MLGRKLNRYMILEKLNQNSKEKTLKNRPHTHTNLIVDPLSPFQFCGGLTIMWDRFWRWQKQDDHWVWIGIKLVEASRPVSYNCSKPPPPSYNDCALQQSAPAAPLLTQSPPPPPLNTPLPPLPCKSSYKASPLLLLLFFHYGSYSTHIHPLSFYHKKVL